MLARPTVYIKANQSAGGSIFRSLLQTFNEDAADVTGSNNLATRADGVRSDVVRGVYQTLHHYSPNTSKQEKQQALASMLDPQCLQE